MNTDTVALHPVEPHPIALAADHAPVWHGWVRTGSLLSVREALAAIAARVARKIDGLQVRVFANDVGFRDWCVFHHSFRCVLFPECSTSPTPATEVSVTVTGAPVFDGVWRVAGTLAVDSLGVVTATTFGVEEYWASQHRELAGQCDHCHKNRKRTVTVLLRNDAGDVLPVGRSCLGDYTGGSVRAAVVAELLALGERIGEAFGVVAAATPDSALLVDVVAVAHLIVDAYGFVPSGYAGPGEIDTRTRLLMSIAPAEHHAPEFPPAALTAEQVTRARSSLDTILADAGASDYLTNLRAVCAEQWCQVTGKGNKLGLLASLPTAVARIVGAAQRRDARAELPSAWIGNPGDKVELTGRVDLVREIDGAFGFSWLVKVETPAGLVKTFTTAAGFADLEVDQTITLKATIKSHDTYNDRRETLLARPKLVSVEG